MTARWSSWKGNGVPDDDSVVADQNLLDQQSDHALTLDYVESFGGRAQTGEKRGQRFSDHHGILDRITSEPRRTTPGSKLYCSPTGRQRPSPVMRSSSWIPSRCSLQGS